MNFVINELELILEKLYGFRCCIPQRDFPGTGVDIEHISCFMSKCQMSIIVLSRQALQSHIQSIERNLARHMELHSTQAEVIYILLDDLSDVTDSHVMSVITGNIGLLYPHGSAVAQEHFYDKLRAKIYKTLVKL